MLRSVSLQNFRSYKRKSFEFSDSTLIVGQNTAGKSNLIEAIYLLSSGKSFRADKDYQMVHQGEEMGRIKAKTDESELEVVVTVGEVAGVRTQFKRYFVNGVPKRRIDFVGHLPSVLFSPEDLEIIIGSPGLRRDFLDNVLEQTDRDYRIALTSYVKGLRQRNALLELVKNGLKANESQFEYWDRLLIETGTVITEKRANFITYLNLFEKKIFDFTIEYDKSIISEERLLQYREAERGAGVTLVGPHRDDFFVLFGKEKNELKSFGSRGQQRLGVLQLKILELQYLKDRGEDVMLLLDDVFSELDEDHINLVLKVRSNQQTIITTTHEEFVGNSVLKTMEVIPLALSS
jgi:DNA replication and repair protein RecF